MNRIVSDIEHIVQHDAQSVLIFAGDLNGLDCKFLEINCGLAQVNHEVTHGRNVLDKVFTNRPDMCTSQTVASTIKTKHKALVVRDLLETMPVIERTENQKVSRRCYDLREPNV